MQRILGINESKEENQRERCHGPNKIESFRKAGVVTTLQSMNLALRGH